MDARQEDKPVHPLHADGADIAAHTLRLAPTGPVVKVDLGADFSRNSRLLLLSTLALPVGVAGAAVAYALVWSIGAITNLAFYQRLSSEFVSPRTNHLGPWVILVPVVGGLIVGFIGRYGSEQIRGHGIPEALENILFGRSRLNFKIAILKPLSSAIAIGTGGPFGAEGPIIMTAGGFGSLFAQLFRLTAAERKTLLAAGAAAGMAAIFASPVSAVLIAIELLLFEWKPRSFVPVAVASAVAGVLRIPLLGPGPIFPVTVHPPDSFQFLLQCAGVGVAAGLLSAVLTLMVYRAEDLFRRLPIHWMWWPAIGGVAVGLAGWVEPRTLGVGYDTIRDLLDGQLLGAAVVGLLVGKALAWSISLGSGNSGGVLAPLLIMGGALGALESHIASPHDPALWAMISMAAVLGGSMQSPLTAIVFAVEVTQDPGALPALLVACTASYAVTVLLMRRSILTRKLARRGFHLSREYSVDPLAMKMVNQVMATDVPRVPSTMRVGELAKQIALGDPWLTHHHAVLVVDEAGLLAGLITRGDVVRALHNDPDGQMTVLEAGSKSLITTYPDEPVYDALHQMLDHDIGRLPVVSRGNPREVLGYFGRSSILKSLQDQMDQEQRIEAGWLVWPKLKTRGFPYLPDVWRKSRR